MMIPGIMAQRRVVAGGMSDAQVIVANLISWWDFQAKVGNDFPDVHGASPLTVSNVAVGTATGKVGNAMSLSGAVYASVDSELDDALVFGDESFTLFFWHFRDTTNNPAAAAVAYLAGRYRTTGGSRSYTCRVLGGTPDRYEFGVSPDGAGFVGVQDGEYIYDPLGWDFIACGYNKEAGNIFLSVNGGAKATTAHTGGVYAGGTALFAIGVSANAAGSTAGSKNGLYDSVGVCGKALTEAEIAVLYNTGAGLDYAALVALT